MLEVGNFQGPLNLTESRSHFGAWCVISSPLILGLDVTDSSKLDDVWDIISNKEAIAVNQAWAGHPGKRLQPPPEYGRCNLPGCQHQVWSKVLGGVSGKWDGEKELLEAVLVINSGDSELKLDLSLEDLGISSSGGGRICMRDIWAKKNIGEVGKGGWAIDGLGQHDSLFYIFSRESSCS